MSSGLKVTYMTDVLPLGLDSVANGLIILLCLQLVFNISWEPHVLKCTHFHISQFWHPKPGQNKVQNLNHSAHNVLVHLNATFL